MVWVACRVQAEAGMLGRRCVQHVPVLVVWAAQYAKDMPLPSLLLPPQY